MRLDSNDFAALYDRHAAELLGFFVRRTYDPDAGVDLLAETFAVAFKDRRQFRGEDPDAARAWLYGVARHRLALFFRRGRVERRALARLGVERRALTEPEYDRIEELAASSELRERLAIALDGLVVEQQDALRLRVWRAGRTPRWRRRSVSARRRPEPGPVARFARCATPRRYAI
jgi:DNA-directed RNA polymerase specialized sigma24 family protein